jgi:hypothetical protein
MPISNSARGRENRRTLGREFPVFEESPPTPVRHRDISMWVEIVDQIYIQHGRRTRG